MFILKSEAVLKLVLQNSRLSILLPVKKIHTSISTQAWKPSDEEPKKFLEYNKKIYPPQSPDEEPRPAVSCLIEK